MASGTLRAALGLPRQDAGQPLIEVAPLITVMATMPATIGEIRLGGVRRKTAAVLYALHERDGDGGAGEPAAKDFEAAVERYRADTDLEQQRRVSTRTITRVGELLANERRAS